MNSKFSNITVIGLGYVGLPTAGLLANKGFNVSGCDINSEIVEIINQGHIHITEKDLEQLINQAISNKNLHCYIEPQPADVFIICVPTPFDENYLPNLSYVESATKSLAPLLQPGNLVILESTSPVGTTEKIANWLAEKRPDLYIPLGDNQYVGLKKQNPIFIAHCPERVLPGQILRELIENDRIIGGLDKASTMEAELFYLQFVTGGFLVTDARTAELVKLAENAFRDVNIAFANELSLICDKLKIDVWELIRLANRHPRVNILKPGPGVGGHCIAVDPWFIVHSAPEQAKLIRTARQINHHKSMYTFEKIKHHAFTIKQPIIACLGLSYKPNIDDLRESPAVHIVEKLAQEKIEKILVVEPNIKCLPSVLADYKNISLVHLDEAIREANIIVLLVAHQSFYTINTEQLQTKIILDSVGIQSSV